MPHFRCCGGYMKVEFGFQSNCSELVAHIGILDREEIIEALKVISDMTGRTWCTDFYWRVEKEDGPSMDSFDIPIPNERLSYVITDFKSVSEAPKRSPLIDYEKLISISKESLEEWQIERIRKNAASNEWMPLRLVSDESMSMEFINRNGEIEKVSWKRPAFRAFFHCGCGRKGLTLDTDNHWVESFPEFHAITREFNSHFYVEDCGYNPIFAEWLVVHFLPDEVQKLLGELYDDPEERRSSISYMKEHPPDNDSKELTGFEQEAISEFRDFLKDLKEERMKGD
jgi:hypothetical protein